MGKINRLLVPVGMLVAVLLAVYVVSADNKVENAILPDEIADGVVGPDATITSTNTVVCTPTHVAAIYEQGTSNRIHVLCKQNFSGIVWFAVPLSSSTKATTFLTLASDAIVNRESLTIGYNVGDISGPAWGCQLANCRPVRWVGIS